MRTLGRVAAVSRAEMRSQRHAVWRYRLEGESVLGDKLNWRVSANFG
jgi:hypothetical protein